MGRQINFYMGKKKQEEFLEFLIAQGYLFLADGVCNEIEYIQPSKIIYESCLCLYKDTYGTIKLDQKRYSNNKYINKSYNPIIEYWRSNIKEEEKCIKFGRIWLSSYEFYDLTADRSIITKDFNCIIRWLKKNLLYQALIGYSSKLYIDEELIGMVCNEGYVLV